MTGPIALCLGGAKSVWSDLARAVALMGEGPRLIVACNFAGIDFPGHLDGWATLHPERFQAMRDQRAGLGRNTDYRAFVHSDVIEANSMGGDAEVAAYALYGSSGLYMAQMAIEQMGASGAILCGVPMDDTGEHIHWPGAWSHAHHYRDAFLAAKAEGWPVRSMSGWSAELFGLPDAEFLGQPLSDGGSMPEDDDMARVRFTGDFPWHPTPRSTIEYKEGMELTVKRACADAAKAAGKAEDLPPLTRDEAAAKGVGRLGLKKAAGRAEGEDEGGAGGGA